jgi:hypothetical protein
VNLEVLLRNTRRGLGALYFEGGFFGALASFSTFMSSPWTIERTASAHDASEATRKYVWLAHVTNVAAGAFVSILARSFAPLFGTAAGTTYMHFVYNYSRRRGLEKGEDWWGRSGFTGDAPAAAAAAGATRRR